MACTTGRYPREEIALHYAPVHSNEMIMAGSHLPRIAIALGDPAGIGPEIALKAALDPTVRTICHPVLFGERSVLEVHAEACSLAPRLQAIARAMIEAIRRLAGASTNTNPINARART